MGLGEATIVTGEEGPLPRSRAPIGSDFPSRDATWAGSGPPKWHLVRQTTVLGKIGVVYRHESSPEWSLARAAAREHGVRLATWDRRALDIYRALEVGIGLLRERG